MPKTGIDHSVGSDGSIVFMTRSEEVLRLDPDGAVFVRGSPVDDNIEVYRAFTSWLTDCRCVECGGRLSGLDNEGTEHAHDTAMRKEFFAPLETHGSS